MSDPTVAEAWVAAPLTRLKDDARLISGVLLYPSGRAVGQFGFSNAADVMSICALTSAINASARELGRQLDGKHVAAIPHTTAALSDRTTAFNEGYAIHLETLEAHIGRDPKIRERYQRQLVLFGDAPFQSAEFFRHSADLTSYSQNRARCSRGWVRSCPANSRPARCGSRPSAGT